MTRRLAVLLLFAGAAAAQGAPNRPYLGYLCAAGGQCGQTVRIVAGGQNLRGAREVVVSGAGVRATVVDAARAPWLLSPDDRRVVAQHLRDLARRRWAEEAGLGGGRRRAAKEGEAAGLPDLPLLRNLESMDVRELRRVAYEYLDPARRSQLSAQIAEVVEIEVRIDADAAPGDRELRIRTPAGLTNPMLFQVGTLPECTEREPNDYRTLRQPPVDAPCVFNGQVSFKDADRFAFRARRGAKLVIEVQARRLVPYLADAVPGWFQATLALFDPAGREVGFADDTRCGPDPVLYYEVPADGLYEIEIRDAIDRGRTDFVYRVTVAERPYVLSAFPAGGRAGVETSARLEGWNLAPREVALDTAPGGAPVRTAAWSRGELWTNPVPYAVGDLPECTEDREDLALPVVVNGRIARAGEIDRFRFEGRAGQEIVAEVQARRLGSPLDSLVQIVGPSGQVVAWNDDHEDPAAGLVTHQADSYVRATLPADGTYAVRVADAQGHAGPAFVYRLRVSAPRPDFEVIVTPASVNVPAGGLAVITAHAVRRDGYAGPIDLALPGAPGMILGGGTIPAGRDRVRMTLAAPLQGRGRAEPLVLEAVARASIDGRTVERRVVPAEDMMQAFGLRHLVPAQTWMADVLRTWRRTPPARLAEEGPARIPLGGTAEVRILAPGFPGSFGNMRVTFALDAPPDGVTLKETRLEPGALVLVLEADPGKAQPGLEDNLIVEAHAEVEAEPDAKRGRAARQRRAATTPLPAIPIAVSDTASR